MLSWSRDGDKLDVVTADCNTLDSQHDALVPLYRKPTAIHSKTSKENTVKRSSYSLLVTGGHSPGLQETRSPELLRHRKNGQEWHPVDAFAAEPFKGNPAAVCLLEDAAKAADERWMQSVAVEFNISETAFLLRDSSAAGAAPLFQLRWFTPAAEVELCGHATLASAHFLFTSVLAAQETLIEFSTKSGILTAKKVPAPESTGVSGEGKLFIELDFPMIDLIDCHPAELPSIPETLNGASVVTVHKSATAGDLIVELSSGKEVADIIPNIHEIKKCSGRGVIVTGPAPAGWGHDFFTRFFCPKFGIDEDPVCGSAHCVLAPYWGRKLGKQKLIAFQASPRSGILYLELEAAGRRVRIQGEAVTVMTGCLLA